MTRTHGDNEAERRRTVIVAGHSGDAETARRHIGDDAPSVRIAAIGALERTGRLTSDELATALADRDSHVRRRALEAAAQRAEIPIDALLTDPDAEVVEVAAWACGERADPAAVPLLCTIAIEHQDALCREAAVAALGAIGDDRGLEAILHATRDKATVRRRAILALAPFEGDEVEAALEHALQDRDWQVRQAAEDLL